MAWQVCIVHWRTSRGRLTLIDCETGTWSVLLMESGGSWLSVCASTLTPSVDTVSNDESSISSRKAMSSLSDATYNNNSHMH